MKKLVNGVEVDLTAEEQAEHDLRESQWDAQTPARIIGRFTEALEKLVADTSESKGYDSPLSCASYALSTEPQWAAEAATFIAWRDKCYTYAYDYLARAQSGEISSPSLEGFMGGVPLIEW